MEAGSKTAKHLVVKYPAELTWWDVTCHVLDQKTLKQKQVRERQAPRSEPFAVCIFQDVPVSTRLWGAGSCELCRARFGHCKCRNALYESYESREGG